MKKNGEEFGTTLTHIGLTPEKYDGVVNTPVHRASTILFKNFEAFKNAKKSPLSYGRIGTPSSLAFEKSIAQLEEAEGSVSTCSGLAAITVAFLSSIKSGDHVLVMDNVYGFTREFCKKELRKFNVQVEFYSPLIGKDIKKLFRENTSVVFMEAPGSITFETCDITAITSAAQEQGIRTILDNSWGTPLLFKPLPLGIDISVMSATKYIAGHSDAMLGVVSGTNETYPQLKQTAINFGLCAGSEELYLGLRGLHTLEVRLKEHEKRGLKIAKWLQEQKAVKNVLHPALTSCPGHKNFKKHFEGSNSTFGFTINQKKLDKLGNMLDSFKLFKMGASWGGYESLSFPSQPERVTFAHDETSFHIRLHIGFENIDDLKEDLANGFKKLK